MAASNTQITILSSSPPRRFAAHNMSSSPLPSPSDLFRKKLETISTCSRAASIPPSASASFTTASALLRVTKVNKQELATAETNDDGGLHNAESAVKISKPKAKKAAEKKKDEEPKPAKADRKTKAPLTIAPEDPNPEAKVKKPRKPRVKKSEHFAEGGGGEPSKVIPKKPRAKKADNGVAAEPKEKAVRKPRAKKVADTSRAPFPEGQVTKSAPRSKKTKDEATELDDSLDFGLVEAVKRKTTWTPPVSTAKEEIDTPAPELVLDYDLESFGVGISSKRNKGFNDLLGSFGFANGGSSVRGSSSTSTKAQDQAVMRKRKLIELVKTTSSNGSISPTKKAPKKKARTITECATAAYAEQDDLNMEPTPLMQYFSLQDKETSTNDGFKVPAKPRSRSPKKGAKEAPILLSPESAMKQVSNQDFVFGTSSQLAREDSPSLLRDLHQAMQASLVHSDPSDYLPDTFNPPAKPNRNLWNAASRGANGELLDVEMTQATKFATETDAFRAEDLDDWLDIDTFAEGNETELPAVEVAFLKDLSSISPTRKPRKSPTPKPFKDAFPSSSQITTTIASKTGIPQMPLYTSYTTAELAKEIASYRFKPVKSREGMIKLLERCWEGKHRAALQTLDANLPKLSPVKASKVPASSQVSPKKPRGRAKKDSSAVTSPVIKAKVGRPRKDSSAAASPVAKSKRPKKIATALTSTLDDEMVHTPKKKQKKSKQPAEDISDSDSPCTPSPPRRRLSQVGQPPKPLQLQADELASSPERTSSQTQALLFEHITKAVTSASPSKGSKNPSWHEKMLLYDPIILEDLAAWLNTRALGKVGWDGEVAAFEVKKWCESKSICCLWKENLRGAIRSRY